MKLLLPGTANIVMAAVLAEGKTTIYNAACEPYLQQLCKMLNRMGAKITGIGSNLLEINGVDSLGGTDHRMLPDMIEIGSWIGLAAMTRSHLTIKDVSWTIWVRFLQCSESWEFNWSARETISLFQNIRMDMRSKII